VVVEAHEIRAVDLLQEADVVETEHARPDHTHSDGPRALRHTINPRCDASMNRRNVSTSAICGSSTARARSLADREIRVEHQAVRALHANFTSGEKPARCSPTELSP